MELNWVETQRGYLKQVSELQTQLTETHKLTVPPPVLCPGDLFHTWNPPVELVNAVMECLPQPFYAVAGNHDLPFHRYADIRKTAYWTLCRSGTVQNVSPGRWATYHVVGKARGQVRSKQVVLHGFPCGTDLKPNGVVYQIRKPEWTDDALHVCLAHRYAWVPARGFPGAPEEARADALAPLLSGYHVALFGDNHKAFQVRVGGATVLTNCGCFARRRLDEYGERPAVAVVWSSGQVTRHPLDVQADRWKDAEAPSPQAPEAPDPEGLLKAYLTELMDLGDKVVDFSEAVNRTLAGLPKDKTLLRQKVLEWVQRCRNPEGGDE